VYKSLPYLFTAYSDHCEEEGSPAAQETRLRTSSKSSRRISPRREAACLSWTVRRLAGVLLVLAFLAAPLPQAAAQEPARPEPEELWQQFPLDERPNQEPAQRSDQQAPTERGSAPKNGSATTDGSGLSLPVVIASIVLAIALILVIGALFYSTRGRFELGPDQLRRRPGRTVPDSVEAPRAARIAAPKFATPDHARRGAVRADGAQSREIGRGGAANGETAHALSKPALAVSAVDEEPFLSHSLLARRYSMSKYPEETHPESVVPAEREIAAHEPVNPDTDDFSHVGERVTAVLASAHEAAEQMRAAAKADAEGLLAEAGERAQTIVAEAERRARSVEQEEVQHREALAAGAQRFEERLKSLLEVFRGMTMELEELVRMDQEEKDHRADEEAEQDARRPVDERLADALTSERMRQTHARSS
jgi:cell division septum initiation protein DivIVA